MSLTSMLDVIFLLLCFFVTVSVYTQWESEISIQLPSAETAEDSTRRPEESIVNITQDGKVKINGMIVGLSDLEARLKRVSEVAPEQTVIIRTDKKTKCEDLIKVIDVCRKASVYNYSLRTDNVDDVKKEVAP